MAENVTIKSIAEALGVSFSTVAKALNGDPVIRESTRRMVEEKAREMHYTRNYFAQTLRQQASRTVAFIVNDIDTPVCGEMIASISAQLAAYGYTTMVSDSLYSADYERGNIQTVLSRMPEAVIFSPVDPAGENMELLGPILSRTLVLAAPVDTVQASFLTVDHRAAGRIGTAYLLDHGSQDNLIFAGPAGYQAGDLFLDGVRDAYALHGLSLTEDWICRFPSGYATAHQYFLDHWQNHNCQGVICFCDSMAFGVYQAARQLGLRVGTDLSVIGYDDGPINDLTDPPLTTVHMPKDLVAARCSQFVIDLLVNGKAEPGTDWLEPYLVERGSVRAL